MAESVDALVSNTSGATHPGSSPGLGTKVQNGKRCESHLTALFHKYYDIIKRIRQ